MQEITIISRGEAMIAQTGTVAAMPVLWIAIVIVLAILVVAIVAIRKRSTGLRSQFGPEYDRAVAATGSRERAEVELAGRQKRVKHFQLRELSPGARKRYAEEWRAVQARFVDAPGPAVAEADHLLVSAMRDRGYPMEDFEQRISDLSVDHAEDVNHYRAAHAISLKNERAEATTEDLRQAIVHFRALFERLLGTNPNAAI
jgi:hypothetical protein